MVQCREVLLPGWIMLTKGRYMIQVLLQASFRPTNQPDLNKNRLVVRARRGL